MLIAIDRYIFEVKHNVLSIAKSTSINFDKQNTITKPVYTHLGGYEDEISFEAVILLAQNPFILTLADMRTRSALRL